MSLKFGIYLVEQRINSPEQFCGLIKIQQESASSLATIAIRRNYMTIKQVARVLTAIEANPSKNFLETASAERFLDQTDCSRLLHDQLNTCPSIGKLLVECGLLTKHQMEVLFNHFEKQTAIGLKSKLPNKTPDEISTTSPDVPFAPPQPKFTQRAVPAKTVSGTTES
jgi:hypothetical protein